MLPPTELRLSRVGIPAAMTGTRPQLIQRTLLQGGELASSQERQATQETPRPDLDALAREVYAILKARLRAERDRHRLYGI